MLIAACAVANLTKAVHVDDSTYLDIVRAILADPLHPMSGTTYSIFMTRPVSFVNQPHLFFYAQALVMLVSRDSELALHVLTAVMAGLAITAFHALAKLVVQKRPLLFTALFALSPAFLPGQNLMVDVPLIALWLAFFWALLPAAEGRAGSRYLAGAVVMALACLVKYTSLVLLPIFVAALVLRREWRALWLLTLPATALGEWSLFNYFDCGSVHLLGREVGTIGIGNVALRAVEWIAGLGAVGTFTVMFWSRANMKRFAGWPFAGGCVTGVALFFSSHEDRQIAALWAIFLGNGVFALGLVCQCVVRELRRWQRDRERVRLERNVIRVLWLVGVFSFVVLFAPFMAVRHILLAIPAMLLLLGHSAGRAIERRWRTVGLGVTAGLGVLLALSDYEYANVYRE